MCTIKPQTIEMSGDMKVVARERHLTIQHDGRAWVLHLSASGDVLGVHREPLLPRAPAGDIREAGSPPPP